MWTTTLKVTHVAHKGVKVFLQSHHVSKCVRDSLCEWVKITHGAKWKRAVCTYSHTISISIIVTDELTLEWRWSLSCIEVMILENLPDHICVVVQQIWKDCSSPKMRTISVFASWELPEVTAQWLNWPQTPFDWGWLSEHLKAEISISADQRQSVGCVLHDES